MAHEKTQIITSCSCSQTHPWRVNNCKRSIFTNMKEQERRTCRANPVSQLEKQAPCTCPLWAFSGEPSPSGQLYLSSDKSRGAVLWFTFRTEGGYCPYGCGTCDWMQAKHFWGLYKTSGRTKGEERVFDR